MDLKRIIQPNDVIIYDAEMDLSRDDRKGGYNIGDLLHIPVLSDKENFKERDGRQQIISEIYKDSIFANYWNSRPKDEFIPNIPRIQRSVEQFVERNFEKHVDIFELVRNPSTLCVHIRSGDLDVTMDYINVIKNLSKQFQTVIVLGGVHYDQVFRLHENKIRAFVHQSNLILQQNHNIYSFLDKPDVHIAVMSQSSNLLLHYGGFSAIGAIVCSGKLYATKLFHHVNCKGWKEKVNKPYILV